MLWWLKQSLEIIRISGGMDFKGYVVLFMLLIDIMLLYILYCLSASCCVAFDYDTAYWRNAVLWLRRFFEIMHDTSCGGRDYKGTVVYITLLFGIMLWRLRQSLEMFKQGKEPPKKVPLSTFFFFFIMVFWLFVFQYFICWSFLERGIVPKTGQVRSPQIFFLIVTLQIHKKLEDSAFLLMHILSWFNDERLRYWLWVHVKSTLCHTIAWVHRPQQVSKTMHKAVNLLLL